MIKPTEFWGLLFRLRNAAFLSLFFAPFFVAGIRHSPWHVLAIALPLGVLLVWEHLPAQSIAFQYTACLFPVLFLGCIEGTSRTSPKRPKDSDKEEDPNQPIRGDDGLPRLPHHNDFPRGE